MEENISQSESTVNDNADVEVKKEETLTEQINTNEVVSETQNSEVEAETKQAKQAKQVKKEGFFSYYTFVFISAIIGYIMLYFLTRLYISKNHEKLNSFIVSNQKLLGIFVPLIAAFLFIFIALIFKKVFKKIFLSEIFLYLYMGVLTTTVNIISFELIRNMLSGSNMAESAIWKVAEISAFVIAVLFAFITNKLFVFKSYSLNIMRIFSELGMFMGARLITEGINFFIMWIMIDKNGFDEFTTKIIASVIVIVLNYIFSKFLIFKKNKNVEKN